VDLTKAAGNNESSCLELGFAGGSPGLGEFVIMDDEGPGLAVSP